MSTSKYTYINREISWLQFNERVLQESADKNVPIIDRLRFLGIFSNNLDEFFRVRYATVKRVVDNEIHRRQVRQFVAHDGGGALVAEQVMDPGLADLLKKIGKRFGKIGDQ